MSALAAVAMAAQPLRVHVGNLQGEGCMEPEPQALDGGEGARGVQGSGGVEQTFALLKAEDGRTTVCGLGAPA